MRPMPSVVATNATHITGRYLPVFDMTAPETIAVKAVPSEKVSILCTQHESAKEREEYHAYLIPAPVADAPSTRKVNSRACIIKDGTRPTLVKQGQVTRH